MKLKLHWAERYEMVREFPTFELDSEQFPELELEMLDVYKAVTAREQHEALDALEYKMHHTTMGERGETIFEMFGPYDHDKFEQSQVHTIGNEIGSFVITEGEE